MITFSMARAIYMTEMRCVFEAGHGYRRLSDGGYQLGGDPDLGIELNRGADMIVPTWGRKCCR
jgi:hypothetical protein